LLHLQHAIRCSKSIYAIATDMQILWTKASISKSALAIFRIPISWYVASVRFPTALYAHPKYVEAHGVPDTPEDITRYSAVMIATESWKISEGKDIQINAQIEVGRRYRDCRDHCTGRGGSAHS
jgi:hypothetical protein